MVTFVRYFGCTGSRLGLRVQSGSQPFLALHGALAAVALGSAGEFGELVVAVAFGVREVAFESRSVAQASLGKPHDVVQGVLVPVTWPVSC